MIKRALISVFDKNGIQICGWRLATEKNKIKKFSCKWK